MRPPDLLVSAENGLIAVRAADGSYLLSKKPRSTFVEETWTRRAAAEAGALWPILGDTADGRLSCDARVCVYRARGRSVALLRGATALAQDCAKADLAVSLLPARGICGATPAIDAIDLRQNGAQAVWLEPGGVRIETVADWRGTRPWTRAEER